MSDSQDNQDNTEPKPACHSTSKSYRWFAYWLIIGIVTAVSTARLIHAIPMKSANDRSRWCTVWSLVEKGTYQIDEIRQKPGWDTIDRVRHEGHFYSSKPALLPVIMSGLYQIEKKTLGWDLLKDKGPTSQVLLFVMNILPMALCLFLLADLVERYAASTLTRFFVLMVAAFSTLLSPFLITFSNHPPAAFSVYIALYALVRIVNNDSKWPTCMYAVCGFFAAFACCNELPAALFGVTIFVYLCTLNIKKTSLAFVPAALVPLIAFFITTYQSTGGLLPFYAFYGTEKYVHIIDGIPSYWVQPKGIDASKESPLTYFFHCTIGHHGLLSLTPLYLLTLWSWIGMGKQKKSPLFPVLWMGLFLTVGVLSFYMTRTSNYNYGGGSVALRWMIWLIPFWIVALIPVIDRYSKSITFRSFAFILILFSTYSSWAPLNSPWNKPWIYSLMEKGKWFNYNEPTPALDHPLSTWFSDLPESENKDDDYWVEFAGSNKFGQTIIWRLSDEGPAIENDKAVRKMRIQQFLEEEKTGDHILNINSEAFKKGEKMAAVLVFEDSVNKKEKDMLGTLVRGMPKYRQYKESSDRFLTTPIRKEAFTCKRAASAVGVNNKKAGIEFRYRSDLWLSDEIPFGTVKWKLYITDNKTKESMNGLTLVAIKVGKIRDSERSYFQQSQRKINEN